MSKMQMQIYRAKDCRRMTDEEGTVSDMPESAMVGLGRMAEAGMTDGYVIKVLFDAPGFALHYAWFKPNYPVARHSHSVDALYYIVSGSLKMARGRRWLLALGRHALHLYRRSRGSRGPGIPPHLRFHHGGTGRDQGLF
jgi:mannose-6-phosphate isomerase-like protein (cupin superfamily)